MRPRLGFLGTGWIGRHRMAALAATGLALGFFVRFRGRLAFWV